jgi:hypothetical protein
MGEIMSDEAVTCPCRETLPVRVRIPADLSCTGKAKWKRVPIDKCIAPLVAAFQAFGIDMRGSCCGHGGDGDIELQDGWILIIKRDGSKYLAER